MPTEPVDHPDFFARRDISVSSRSEKALESFDPIWDKLFPAEKARVLRLLVEEVRYHGKAGEVKIIFRPGGIRVLASGGMK